MSKRHFSWVVVIIVTLAIIGFLGFLVAPLFIGVRVFSQFALTSWSLGAFAVIGFLLIGKRVWWAWCINVACQVLWIIYWVIQDDPRPIITNVVYILVFAQNAYLWAKEYHVEEKHLPKSERKLGRLFPRIPRTDADVDEEDR